MRQPERGRFFEMVGMFSKIWREFQLDRGRSHFPRAWGFSSRSRAMQRQEYDETLTISACFLTGSKFFKMFYTASWQGIARGKLANLIEDISIRLWNIDWSVRGVRKGGGVGSNLQGKQGSLRWYNERGQVHFSREEEYVARDEVEEGGRDVGVQISRLWLPPT